MVGYIRNAEEHTELRSYARQNNLHVDKYVSADLIEESYDADSVLIVSKESLGADYYYYYFELLKNGTELIELHPSEDSVKDILRSIVDKEKEHKTSRSFIKKTAMKSSGKYSGGRVPFGYKAENGVLIVDERESDIVRDIFYMRECEGLSALRIAQILNVDNKHTRSGGEWVHTTIYSILNNRKIYEGYVKVGADYVKGEHTPIL